MSRCLVLDNGGGSIKAGFAGVEASKVRIPNCAARIKKQLKVLLGDETETQVKDCSQLHYLRPVDRGYVVNWPLEGEIWKYLFGKVGSPSPSDTALLVTEPSLSPPELEESFSEVVFETFGFSSCFRPSPSWLSLHYDALKHPISASGCGVVVDSGFSFTHATPVFEGKMVLNAVRRLDVGGKLLTNYLKELITHRQWNMMDDTFVVNQVKEELCFCAQDFVAELASAKAAVSLDARRAAAEAGVYPGLLREFVLPDYHSVLKGFVKTAPPPIVQPELEAGAAVLPPPREVQAKPEDSTQLEAKGKTSKGKRKRQPRKRDGSDEEGDSGEEEEDEEEDDDMKAEEVAKIKALEAQAEAERQVLVMNNERISVPEVLFHPIDVGLSQGGVVETVVQAIEACPAYMRGPLFCNIVLTGGNTLLPGYTQRIQSDLRSLAPSEYDVVVHHVDDPIWSAWNGGSSFVSKHGIRSPHFVTKAEYEETGHSVCLRWLECTAQTKR